MSWQRDSRRNYTMSPMPWRQKNTRMSCKKRTHEWRTRTGTITVSHSFFWESGLHFSIVIGWKAKHTSIGCFFKRLGFSSVSKWKQAYTDIVNAWIETLIQIRHLQWRTNVKTSKFYQLDSKSLHYINLKKLVEENGLSKSCTARTGPRNIAHV